MGNAYELMVVLSPELTEEKLTGVKGKINDEMNGLGAVIEKEDDWGKRDLAFEVKDFHQGFYHLYTFDAPPDMPVKMKRLLKVNESIIRYLITEKKPLVLVLTKKEREEAAALEAKSAEETKPVETKPEPAIEAAPKVAPEPAVEAEDEPTPEPAVDEPAKEATEEKTE